MLSAQSQCLRREIEYLGYIMGEGCLKVNPEKVAAISTCSTPKNLRQLRRALGITGWHIRFISDFATINTPLTDLLRKNRKFMWNSGAEKVFHTLKRALFYAPGL